MNDEPRPQTHDHIITYGVHTLTKMEVEGWELAAAWITQRPDEGESWFVWKRPVRSASIG